MGSQISSNDENWPAIHDSQSATFFTLYRPFITKFFDSIFYNSEALFDYEPDVRRNLISESINNIYNVLNHIDINDIIQHMNLTIHYLNNIDLRNNLHPINNVQQINNQQINDIHRINYILRDVTDTQDSNYILNDVNNTQGSTSILNDVTDIQGSTYILNDITDNQGSTYILHDVNDIQGATDILHNVNDTQGATDILHDVNEIHRINAIQGANNYIQEVIFIIQNENFPDIYISRINDMIENVNNVIHDINDNRSNGVPLEIINSLREKIFSADTDDSCAICLKNYKEKEILTVLFCNHSFHKECIKRWFENNNNCPICRQILKF